MKQTKYICIIAVFFSCFLLSCTNDNIKTKEKSPFYVEIKGDHPNLADDIFKYLKELLTIIGIGAGIIIGYPALRKKLREDHIKKLLDETQEANKETKFACHKLIDKYLSRTYSNEPVHRNDIQKVFIEIVELNEKALNASKEVVTLSILLKTTIQRVLRHYDPKKHYSIITTDEFYGLFIVILYEIIFFSEKIVTIPWNQSTKQITYLNKRIEKFVSNNKYKKFKYFEQGFDNNVTSPLYFFFYASIHKCSHFLFHRSAYKIFESPVPIARLLYLNKLYFPVILESNGHASLFNESQILKLVSFKTMTQLNQVGEKNIIKFTYANTSELFHFVDSLTKKQFEEGFSDSYINSNGIELNKVNKFSKGKLEFIQIEIDYSLAKSVFDENEKELIKQMKKEIKENQ